MINKNLFLIASVFIALFFSAQFYAQNQSPVVSGVKFAQRMDGSFIVDVHYDVNDAEGSTMTATMKVSSDNGATWDFSCNNVSGDVGSGITNGTNKHIVWDFGAEHPETFGDQFRIKIIADDGSIVMGVPCPGLATVNYAGKTYNTVQIGNQCWLRENLDIGTRIDGNQNQTNDGLIQKYCYNDDPNNCTAYGGLYQWNEAMQYVTTEGAKGICPAGWHIPKLSEFEALSAEVGGDGNSLKEIGQGTGSGAGTNTSGFSALLAGYHYFGFGATLGYNTYFWSSTEYSATGAYNMYLLRSVSSIGLNYYNKDYGYSVRCLKD